MAYNRDWDKGKDSWNQGAYEDDSNNNAWGLAGGGNVRYREDDQWNNEGKRRKYNNGVGGHL